MRHDKAWYWTVVCGCSLAGVWCAQAVQAQPREAEVEETTDAQTASPVVPESHRPPTVNVGPSTQAIGQGARPGGHVFDETTTLADTLADRMERAAQRATAMEFESQLAELLGPDGLPVELGPGPVRDALKDIATRCHLLARSTSEPYAREVLVAPEARVYNALAQDAWVQGESVEIARGLGQLRAAAQRLGEVETPHAAAAGAYWLMLADLIDANRTIEDAADRRVFVRELLSLYVADYPGPPADEDGPAMSDYVLDARVALAHLLDESGEQHAAHEALGPLIEATPDDPRYSEVQPIVARCTRVGEPVELELPTATGQTWSLSDFAGKPVLIHIFAHGVGDSAESITALRRAIARARLGGYAVVSLHVGALIPDHALPPWPTMVVEPEQRGVLDALGVDAVPMYVWIDERGRLASVGKTLEVVARIPQPDGDEAAPPDADGDADAAATPDVVDPDVADPDAAEPQTPPTPGPAGE